MEWTIRRATPADADAVKAVAAAGWRDTYSGLLRSETIDAFLAGPYAIENVVERITAHDFFVTEGVDGIAAYADAVGEGNRIFLAAIYALPVNRGQGAGTALLGAITSRHPMLPIDAYVLLGNRKGETFYERRGFSPVETVAGDLFGERVTERRWRRPGKGENRSAEMPLTTVREATPSDEPFLAEMLVEAAYPPGTDPKPTRMEAVADPRAGRYLRNWGRPGDRAVVAESGGQPIGAAWYRRLSAGEPGYGFVAEDVPELALAVAAAWRGKGVGRRLLTELIEVARASGERAMSLSVSTRNPAALSLYEQAGFLRVAGTDDHPTLVLELGRQQASIVQRPRP